MSRDPGDEDDAQTLDIRLREFDCPFCGVVVCRRPVVVRLRIETRDADAFGRWVETIAICGAPACESASARMYEASRQRGIRMRIAVDTVTSNR